MRKLDDKVSLRPTMQAALPKPEHDLEFVKVALGGQPLARWVADWRSPEGELWPVEAERGDLYEALFPQIEEELYGRQPDTVTLIWMQGEREAKEGWSGNYAENFRKLIAQFQRDLEMKEINVVIGRLNSYGLYGTDEYPHWEQMRQIQMDLAASDPRWTWVDTDEWNREEQPDGSYYFPEQVHYLPEGYAQMGRAFAEAALALLRENDGLEPLVIKGPDPDP